MNGPEQCHLPEYNQAYCCWAEIPFPDLYLDTQGTSRNRAGEEIAFLFCKIFWDFKLFLFRNRMKLRSFEVFHGKNREGFQNKKIAQRLDYLGCRKPTSLFCLQYMRNLNLHCLHLRWIFKLLTCITHQSPSCIESSWSVATKVCP